MKKRVNVLTIIGLLLIAAALCLTIYNLADQARAYRAAQSTLDKMEFGSGSDYIANPEQPMPTVMINGREYIGKLEIPAIDIEIPVQSSWSYDALKVSPCRYQGSAYLSDFVVCAHNYDYHFGRIKKLQMNDTIIFTDIPGHRLEYKVCEVEILKPTAIDEMRTGDWDMTLFTCTIGGRTRVTVRCRKI